MLNIMKQVVRLNTAIVLINMLYLNDGAKTGLNFKYRELTDHTMVTDDGAFPFVAAILWKSVYLSAGALINDFWVITAADALFLIRESTRIIRVRLGSVNNKKGGRLYPVKSIEIHPSFDDNRPQFDIALVLLPRRARFAPTLSPVKLQTAPREVDATHFIVNAWPAHVIPSSVYPNHTESLDTIKRRRMMTVSHLHPSSKENCTRELGYLNLTAASTIMCLDPAIGTDPCLRDVGAPVVLNGILWGIMSSWIPEDCDLDPGPIFVTLVASRNISTWIHATIGGHRWNYTQSKYQSEYYDEYDYYSVE